MNFKGVTTLARGILEERILPTGAHEGHLGGGPHNCSTVVMVIHLELRNTPLLSVVLPARNDIDLKASEGNHATSKLLHDVVGEGNCGLSGPEDLRISCFHPMPIDIEILASMKWHEGSGGIVRQRVRTHVRAVPRAVEA